jgi:hypothetical protein
MSSPWSAKTPGGAPLDACGPLRIGLAPPEVTQCLGSMARLHLFEE